MTIADVNRHFPGFPDIIVKNGSLKIFQIFILKQDGQTVEEAIKNKKQYRKIIVQFNRYQTYGIFLHSCFDANELIKIYDIFADQTDIFKKLHESNLILKTPCFIITTDINGNILNLITLLDLTKFRGINYER